MSQGLTILDFLRRLRWLDGSPLLPRVEAYRRRNFERFFDERDETGRPWFNLGVFGRAKKNFKTSDEILAAFFAMLTDSVGGSQVYLIANDEDQAGAALTLAKKLAKANPETLGEDVTRVKANVIERRDGEGFIEVLPKDAVGSHGLTYRLLCVDELHGHRDWDVLEALALDPTRPDAQQWITSYASLFHKPGVPLFDLIKQGRAGTDPRMLFDWWSADWCTAPADDIAGLTPGERANPSRAAFDDPDYLAQQQRRLPSNKFRRLHLNLPGMPEGTAYQSEPVMDAVDRGVSVRAPLRGLDYRAFVDMSGGSSDDAVLAIGHLDVEGRAILDLVVDQGQRPPFDPNKAVQRFVATLQRYRVSRVVGDRYAGRAFAAQFEEAGISYDIAEQTASQAYEALEPRLNGGRIVLLDVPMLEQQLLGLAWRAGRINHAPGDHDDYANAAAGVVVELFEGSGYSEDERLDLLSRGGEVDVDDFNDRHEATVHVELSRGPQHHTPHGRF